MADLEGVILGSGGKTLKQTAIARGCMIPAVRPCSRRPALSVSALGARPDIPTPTRNPKRDVMYVARSPKMETSQACSSIPAVIAAKNPEESHCASFRPIPNAPIISGKATFTVVCDRTIVMAPSIQVMDASHL